MAIATAWGRLLDGVADGKSLSFTVVYVSPQSANDDYPCSTATNYKIWWRLLPPPPKMPWRLGLPAVGRTSNAAGCLKGFSPGCAAMENDSTSTIVERSAVLLLPLEAGGTLRVVLDPYSSAMEAVTALALQIGPDARVFPNRAGGEIVSFTVEVGGSMLAANWQDAIAIRAEHWTLQPAEGPSACEFVPTTQQTSPASAGGN